MSDRTDTNEKPGCLARLLGFRGVATEPQDEPTEPPLALEDMQKQIKRMAKEVYKANALAESSINDNRETLAALQSERTAAQADEIAAARLELAKALLPVADGIGAGLQTGASQVQAVAVESPEAAHILKGWLGGQRLLRDRVLHLLESEGIRMMQPVGDPFDPHRHVAVKTVSHADQPNNVVIAVELDGYLHGDEVLRFAEVVVNRVTTQPNPPPETE